MRTEFHRHLDQELDELRDAALRLGGEAEAALRRALESLVKRNSEEAREVLDHDDAIDQLMAKEPSTATRDARLLFVAKHLERIGDYVTDICELTVYMAEAAIIKHRH